MNVQSNPAAGPAAGPGIGRGSPVSAETQRLRTRAHAAIPGGCHTSAKGDDQYPLVAPAFIERGSGCHVVDTDGREYIEYAMGLRSVTLGHAWPSVNEAAVRALSAGQNFNRPTALEVETAEMFLSLIDRADMVKFTKDGSTVMTAAVKLARAHTGRDLVALCSDSPFFSYDDWFIGTTEIDAGIPRGVKSMTISYDYNDIASLERLFDEHPERICAVVLEPVRLVEPEDDFLARVRALCDRHGALLVFDETLTGFRFHVRGAQHLFQVTPDLSCFGKAMANGFALAALAGKREVMELGGLDQTRVDRVFLLSTTHGAESSALAASLETMRIYRDEPVVQHLYRVGERLRRGYEAISRAHGLQEHVIVEGRSCNLIFGTLGPDGTRSQPFRTLFLQELCRGGVLAPSFYTSYSHRDEDIDRTLEAVDAACEVYVKAMDAGSTDGLLLGPPSASAYRKRNVPRQA